jgi:hypothetical protein
MNILHAINNIIQKDRKRSTALYMLRRKITHKKPHPNLSQSLKPRA